MYQGGRRPISGACLTWETIMFDSREPRTKRARTQAPAASPPRHEPADVRRWSEVVEGSDFPCAMATPSRAHRTTASTADAAGGRQGLYDPLVSYERRRLAVHRLTSENLRERETVEAVGQSLSLDARQLRAVRDYILRTSTTLTSPLQPAPPRTPKCLARRPYDTHRGK